ncbi:hypothetical protein [Synechococcus sp. PCC 6312]|nr:hypothetical protein [Synechococcus sp. PCC 6312]AFY61897.1 hypothetical protein Syn6312_2822 [Synechococcus sp. PCC 6312]
MPPGQVAAPNAPAPHQQIHQQVLDGTLDEMPTPIREEYIGWKRKLGIE